MLPGGSADSGGDQIQVARVEAWDGVAETDGVAGGEAGRDADDALLPSAHDVGPVGRRAVERDCLRFSAPARGPSPLTTLVV